MSPLFSKLHPPALLPAGETPVFGEPDDAQPVLPTPCCLLFFENTGRIVSRGRIHENDVRPRVFLNLRLQRTEAIESQLAAR